ncbi:MAG: sigma-70 family RNA polymerase sigma factor [Acidobacteriota bacterium]
MDPNTPTPAAVLDDGALAESFGAMSLDDAVDALVVPLLRYCRGRTRDEALAEDAAQEALAALVDRWRRHGPPSSPAAFAFTVARRRLGRVLARRRLWAPLEAVAAWAGGGAPPSERLAVRQELTATLAAIDRLSPALRDALLLVSAGELDVATASRVLGISKSALKMRVSRARALLLAAPEEAES